MLLRSSEIARELGLHRNTIIAMANKGLIPCSRLPGSGHYRFDLEEVKAALRVIKEDDQ